MLFKQLSQHAHDQAQQIALQGAGCALTYAQLQVELDAMQSLLAGLAPNATFALAVENHPAWVIIDVAAMANQQVLVPIPSFFSPQQMQHAVQDAGAQWLITDQPERLMPIFSPAILVEQLNTMQVAGKNLTVLRLNTSSTTLPIGTAKITYTSGTTGNPKGVCLSVDAMMAVANSIAQAAELTAHDQHLCVLPLATLLENVAGVYAALIAGATVHLHSAAQVGLTGSSLDVTQLVSTLVQTQASTAIFIPEMLQALVYFAEKSSISLPHLRFLAVGGASVSPQLLQRAAQLKLPVFEGYGLSESASVVALNTPKMHKVGSVGKPLSHVTIQITAHHEVLVKGASLLGYTREHALTSKDGFVDTGDIGYLDSDGFLFINGRKKNVFITSFGRNVSPEWVERELKMSAVIAQAALFGEAKPWNTAVIVPRQPNAEAAIQTAVDRINAHLPDYARIHRWIIAEAPFTTANHQLTNNGRNRRDAIWQQYADKINALYLN